MQKSSQIFVSTLFIPPVDKYFNVIPIPFLLILYCIFTGLDNLDQLILNYNHISHLGPGMFSNLPKLSTLYMDHNQIRTIHPDAFTDLQGTKNIYNANRLMGSRLIESAAYCNQILLAKLYTCISRAQNTSVN